MVSELFCVLPWTAPGIETVTRGGSRNKIRENERKNLEGLLDIVRHSRGFVKGASVAGSEDGIIP